VSEYSMDELGEDLRLLIKAGLVDISIKENGDWVYRAVDGVSDISTEQILAAINAVIEEEESEGV